MGQLQSLRRCSGGGGGHGLPADLDLVMLDAPSSGAVAVAAAAAAADPREQELQAALAALLEESRACLAGVRETYQDQGRCCAPPWAARRTRRCSSRPS